MSIDSPNTEFTVVINPQEQYSIWPTYHPIPNGWKAVGVTGNKETCLAHINEVWRDMRPKSLREALAE
ncbi:MbtH family protein [Vibrio neptunius]|uniref:MbtH family protein n=1 Tax=Vibrio neptunius TaxID=170651 RepID=UPI0019D0CF69|nr:MbtH family NRPS accessory protein [Vibrio neptunius]MBN3571740.1 MbtH family NRPS accessory protein [Vibrio neptunius]QXX05514.1 MbtH family NRPS accessory protein [Vibrio neptunius]